MDHITAETKLADALNDDTCFAFDWFPDAEFHTGAKAIFLTMVHDPAAFDGMTVWGDPDEKDEVIEFLRDNPRYAAGADFSTRWQFRIANNIRLFPED